MRNDEIMYLRLKRGEVCDLLLACLAANAEFYQVTGEESKKWMKLHNKLKKELKDFDDLLDIEKPLPFN